MKRILTNRLFMTTFVADMISNFGDSLYYLALMSYVLQLPDAKFGIALVTLSETVPLVTRFILGVKADQTKRKLDMIFATLIFRIFLYSIVGLAMGFSPALWIVIVAVVVNIFSDLSGSYESYLYSPISLRVVSNEDREQAMAFRQGASSVLQIAFQGSGAALVGLMSYQLLAFVNAGTFAISALLFLLIRPALTKLLAANPIQVVEKTSEQHSFVSDMSQSLKGSWKIIQTMPVLKSSVVTIMGVNAIGSTLDTLFVTTIKDFSDFIIVNPATTLVLVSIIFFAGNLLGNILCTTVFKKINLLHLVNATVFGLILFMMAMVGHNLYAAIATLFVMAIISGGVNPKFGAMIMNEIPEEKLGTIGSGIDTLLTVGILVSKFALSGLVVVLSAQQISGIYLLLSILLFVYTLKGAKKVNQTN